MNDLIIIIPGHKWPQGGVAWGSGGLDWGGVGVGVDTRLRPFLENIFLEKFSRNSRNSREIREKNIKIVFFIILVFWYIEGGGMRVRGVGLGWGWVWFGVDTRLRPFLENIFLKKFLEKNYFLEKFTRNSRKKY
jgi:hypothetical protein